MIYRIRCEQANYNTNDVGISSIIIQNTHTEKLGMKHAWDNDTGTLIFFFNKTSSATS